MINEDPNLDEYRHSHSSPDYGHVYSKTYSEGYYFDQWTKIERPLLAEILRDVQVSGRDEVLDFACGTGRITALLEEIFPNVTGVDVSETMLGQARTNCEKAEFLQQDITQTPLDKSFDVVTAFRFFLNAQDELRRGALTAIHRSLNDDGRFVLNIHVNRYSILGIAYGIRNAVRRRVAAKTCSYGEINSFLEEAGFVVESTSWYSYLPRMGWRYGGFSKKVFVPLERFANWFPLFPKRAAQSFIIVARKR